MAARPKNGEHTHEHGPYKMSTIARLTNFSPLVLRAWERRYRLLQPQRGPGGHRLYTEDDLFLLRRVRLMIDSGRSIGEIASMGREALLHESETAPVRGAEPLDGHREVEERPSEALPRLFHWKKSIVQAALSMNGRALDQALDESFASVSAESVIHDVIVPAAREIGDLWMAGHCTVASEHLASGVFGHRVRKLIESASSGFRDDSPKAVGACFPEENHELGLLILTYHLVRRGVPVAFLGAALPFEDLDRACAVMRPRAVLLSVTRSGLYLTHKQAMIEFLEHLGSESVVCLGGAGVPEEDGDMQRAGARLFTPSARIADVVNELVAAIGMSGSARSSRSGRSQAR